MNKKACLIIGMIVFSIILSISIVICSDYFVAFLNSNPVAQCIFIIVIALALIGSIISDYKKYKK